jgi:hypothetical protein
VLNFKIFKSSTVIPKVIDVYRKEVVQREHRIIAQDDNRTFISLIIRYSGMAVVYSEYWEVNTNSPVSPQWVPLNRYITIRINAR